MNWKDIYGRPQILRSLRAALAGGSVAHAYLFCGPEGIGKRTLAKVFSAALVCQRAQDEPCGSCPCCLKSEALTHPDIHWIVPEGKSLKIGQTRDIKRAVYFKPHEARRQVFILERAETLTAEAANSLLKVLEDPPLAAVFILLARSSAALLPTVVSRCQLFLLPRLDAESMAGILKASAHQLPLAESKRAIYSAEGIPGRALRLARAGRRELYPEAVSLLRQLSAEDFSITLADKLAADESLALFLETLLTVLRDLMVLRAAGKGRLVLPAGDVSACLAGKLSFADLLEATEIVLKLEKDLESPVNVRLALESALRRLKEVFKNGDGGGDPL